MRIVFGHNHFLSKKVSPSDIGLHQQELKGMFFEKRQKYVHLYWIPVFPIGQEWYLRKNGELHLVNDDVKRKLKSEFSSFVDWKAFALPILVVLGFSFFNISDAINDRQNAAESLVANTQRMDFIKNQFNKINNYSCLEFKKNYDKIYYKVKSVSKDSVQLIEFENPLPTLPGVVPERGYSASASGYSSFLPYILKKTLVLDTFWVSKKEILQSMKDENSSEVKYIKSINPTEPLELVNVYQFDDAEFVVNTSEESKSPFYFELQNFGLDAKIDSIVAKQNETWEISKQRDVTAPNKFAIRTENGTEATLYYTTKENKKSHLLKLKRNSGELYIDNKTDD